MENKIESKVASTILEKPDYIEFGGQSFKLSPPSLATLIMVSEEVAKLPKLNNTSEKAVVESLRVAKDCKGLGDILAILILGAKEIKDEEKQVWWHKLIRRKALTKKHIAQLALDSLTPSQMSDIIAKNLTRLEIADFFALTTFLSEVNVAKPTKVD